MASNRGDIDRRVVRAAEAALAERKFVTAIDVLVGVGWLEPRRVDEWRQGRVDYLERVTVANLGKISTAMRSFRRWAQARGLELPSYRTVEQSGPAHAPAFTVELALAAYAPQRATGRSKREAEQAAAESMLARVAQEARRNE